MMSMCCSARVVLAACAIIGAASHAHAIGRVIAVGDEWIVSNDAFTLDPVNTSSFVVNTANYFTGGGPGNFLVYTGQSQFSGSSFLNTMTTAGHTITVNPALPLTLANMLAYDGVFLSGTNGSGSGDISIWASYVANGGGVFVAGGTGTFGNAAAEAAAWNPLLNLFGLAFGNQYVPVPALINAPLIAGSHPLQSGMTQVVWGYGQEVIDLDAIPNNANAIAMHADFSGWQGSSNYGIVGTYNVPAPAGVALLGAAMLGALRRRR